MGNFYHPKLNDIARPQIWYCLHLLSLLNKLLIQNLQHENNSRNKDIACQASVIHRIIMHCTNTMNEQPGILQNSQNTKFIPRHVTVLMTPCNCPRKQRLK